MLPAPPPSYWRWRLEARLHRFRPYTALRINARTRLLRDWRYLKATTA